jgi:hypothetical protein
MLCATSRTSIEELFAESKRESSVLQKWKKEGIVRETSPLLDGLNLSEESVSPLKPVFGFAEKL